MSLTEWIEDQEEGPTNGADRHFRNVAEMFAGVADGAPIVTRPRSSSGANVEKASGRS